MTQGGEAPTERQGKWGHETVREAQGVMRERKEADAQEEQGRVDNDSQRGAETE